MTTKQGYKTPAEIRELLAQKVAKIAAQQPATPRKLSFGERVADLLANAEQERDQARAELDEARAEVTRLETEAIRQWKLADEARAQADRLADQRDMAIAEADALRSAVARERAQVADLLTASNALYAEIESDPQGRARGRKWAALGAAIARCGGKGGQP